MCFVRCGFVCRVFRILYPFLFLFGKPGLLRILEGEIGQGVDFYSAPALNTTDSSPVPLNLNYLAQGSFLSRVLSC